MDKSHQMIKTFLDAKLENSHRYGKILAMVDELRWIDDSFVGKNILKHNALEIERRGAVLKDRIFTLEEEIKNNTLAKEGEKNGRK